MTLIKNIPANTQTQQPDLQLQSSGCSAQLFKPVLPGIKISQSKSYKSDVLTWYQLPDHQRKSDKLINAEVACFFLPEVGLAELKVAQKSANNVTLILLVQHLKCNSSQNPVPSGKNVCSSNTCPGLCASKVVTKGCHSHVLECLSPGFRYLHNNNSEN